SSYRPNALGMHDPGITPHSRYLALGTDPDIRLQAYRELFKDALDQADADALRTHTRQNKAFGNERFRSRIEALIGRSVEVRPRGRPASASGKCTRPLFFPQRRDPYPGGTDRGCDGNQPSL